MLLPKVRNIIFNSVVLFSVMLLAAGCSSRPKSKGVNRLSTATSHYLLEHADNPVHWQEWGPEALAQAKEENKPLLISIGYASCHWCHAMEQESFMDTAVARLMNESFVCIKVDREERPDIDKLYLHACQLLHNGEGGWPLNAFALPDGRPFFAGTYYSKDNWTRLLAQISDSYQNKNSKVVLQAASLSFGIADNDSLLLVKNKTIGFTKELYTDLFKQLEPRIDFEEGGLKGTQKFPVPSLWNFLLQYNYFTGNKDALAITEKTLYKMALGGIYDPVAGGFSRYSTDSLWHIPHFEKMLYDNGQLVSLYAAAYQRTKNPFYKEIVKETLAFIERDLSSQEGGFYSSVNADSKEGEGIFYSWTLQEFRNAAEGNADLLAEYYHISEQGNWEHKKNILYATERPEIFAVQKNIIPAEFNRIAGATMRNLQEMRSMRTRPAVDTKIVAGWNGIMLNGYADSYAATSDPVYLQKALKNARFLEKFLMAPDGKLLRTFSAGKASGAAFLDDYAWVSDAFIKVYQLTFDKHWLSAAQKLTDYTLLNFFDSKTGMFWYASSKEPGLAVKKMEVKDEAIPSSNAVMAKVLYGLGVFFSREDYLSKARHMLDTISGSVTKTPEYFAQWCWLAGLSANGTREVAVTGPSAQIVNMELHQTYLPSSFFMGSNGKEDLPFLEGKGKPGQTVIYVCSNNTCKLPVEKPEQAVAQINSGYGTAVLPAGTIINYKNQVNKFVTNARF